MADAKTLVGRGVALLDERYPGWEEKINLHTLEIMSCHECICGQLYGSFPAGAWKLGFGYHDAYMYGFYRYPEGPKIVELNGAWRDVIVEKRAKKARKRELAEALI